MNPDPASSTHDADRTGPTPRQQRLEVSVFLLLVVPSMVLSFFVVRQGGMSFVLTAYSVILRDVGLVALVLFFLWRNGESLTRIGWRSDGWVRELLLGAILFVPFFFLANLLEATLVRSGLHAPSAPLPFLQAEGGLAQSALGLLLVLVVAVAEETIFRGYLILRFRSIATSTAFGVVMSTFVFALGHGYEGSAGLVTVGFMGLVFAVIYLWRASLVAPMAMHFLQDFIGVVVAPLLNHT